MLKREEQLVKDAAEFLVLHQIPTLVCINMKHSTIYNMVLDTILEFVGKIKHILLNRPDCNSILLLKVKM